MKKRIAIIGANEFQNPLILKAKEMGYETHVFAWQDGSVGERTADHFYPISIVEKEKILTECHKIKPDAVATIGTDLGGQVVNYLSGQLGLTCNDAVCSLIATNKYEMRTALKQAGVPTPGFVKVNERSTLQDIQDLTFPLIVKPTDRSGSRGVTKVERPEDWKAAVMAACGQSFGKEAITEEFIEGEEFSCECISYRGQHTYLALTKKYTTGSPHYIETAHLQPTNLSAEQLEAVKTVVFAALDALKISNGASHSELKIDKEGNIGIIEIGARMGGDCIGSHLVPLSTGYDFVGMVVDVAAGNAPKLQRGEHFAASGIRFIYSERDLQQLDTIRRQAPEKLQYVSEIHMGDEADIVDSSTRFGYYIVGADSVEELKKMLELT